MAESVDDKSRYETLRKELVATLPKKRALDRQLAQVEANIFSLETRYLLDTAVHSGGNIIHGFEGYLKNQGGTRKRADVQEADRIFSNSSASYQKSLELLNEGDDDTAPNTPNPNGISTISIPPAPLNASFGTKKDPRSAAATKREKDREYSRKRRAASRMSTETGSGGEESIAGASTSGRRPYKRARIVDD